MSVDSTEGKSADDPRESESADAHVTHRDRALVAAAATTNPLLRVCRTLVVLLSGGNGKRAVRTRHDLPTVNEIWRSEETGMR